MNLDYTEEEKLEYCKKWLQKHGHKIIIIVAIGMLLFSANYYWKVHCQKQKYQASMIYEKLMQASSNKNNDKVQSLAKTIIKKYSRTVYADISHLILAKLAVEQEKYHTAKQQLQFIIGNSSRGLFVDIANIRLARILIYEKDYKSANKLLEAVKQKTLKFAALNFNKV